MGGVYVRFFMKDPKAPLRRPKVFLEGLLEQFVGELGKHGEHQSSCKVIEINSM